MLIEIEDMIDKDSEKADIQDKKSESVDNLSSAFSDNQQEVPEVNLVNLSIQRAQREVENQAQRFNSKLGINLKHKDMRDSTMSRINQQ